MSTKADIIIKEYQESDKPGAIECLIILQDYVENLEPEIMSKGTEMAPAYLEFLISETGKKRGKIYIAELENTIAGLICFWFTKEEYESAEALYISDLVVLEKFRGLGIGTKLLEFAENYAKEQKARFIKISALVKNTNAANLYRKAGYKDYSVTLLKTLY